jgi:pyruvate dehydrogenase E1 component alpha subunit
MPSARIDGNDVGAVYVAVGKAVGRARAGGGPTFIEALTYRHKGHSRTDPATYRPKEEVEEWLARDPIPALERLLLERGADAQVVADARQAATSKVEQHLERALSWPEPDVDARFEHVYA